MYQKQDKTVSAADIPQNADCESETRYGRYYPWSEIAQLRWEQVEELSARPFTGDNVLQSGCYEKQGCVKLVGAAEPQIRECISLCGDKLRVLDLSRSAITQIPEAIRNLKSLRKLGLRGLHLTELPNWLPEIAERFSLRVLDVEGGKKKAVINLNRTSVEDVDMSIFEHPYEMVAKWFEERQRGKPVLLNEIKVVFLGDGEAGKSHMIARLMNDGGDPLDYMDRATPGIVIRDKQYDLHGRIIKVHFWDFGGQEIMHSMHRIFMTNRTMYVVVVDALDGTGRNRAMYWLQNIRSFAPNAQVILVLNKIDQNPNASVDERYLRMAFPNLTQVVRLSALEFDREQFNREFTNVLLNEIEKTGLLDALWPISWIKLKNRLDTMSSEYIMGDSYRQLCREAQVEDMQTDLLHWFNDLGISFCFCDDEDYGLSDHIVLRPDWITNAIYIILFNRLEEARNGLVPHSAIYTLLTHAPHVPNIRCTLPQARYSIADAQYILGILRKFRLSLPSGGDNEFIPMLCQQHPAIDIHRYERDEKTLEFHMEFDYLPDNLLHRLMVERHEELDTAHAWRTGARFVQKKTDLSAVVAIDGNTLKFFIRHADSMHRPNTYLTMLKAHVDRIVDKMGLKKPECGLVYKLEGKREFFAYEELGIMLAHGRTHTYSRLWGRMLPIADILDQSAPEALQEEQKLLQSVIRACRHIQAEPEFRTSTRDTEEMRIRRIRDDLTMLGYLIMDQTQRGVSGRSKAAELDLILQGDRGAPWTAINTMTIHDRSVSRWNQNLTKLLYEYNHYGFSTVFAVNFVECRKQDFAGVWEHYRDHLRRFAPDRSRLLEESFKRLISADDLYFIQTARCTYSIGGYQVTVYHLFVQMDAANVPAAPEKKLRNPEPEATRSSELVLMEGRVVFLGDSEAGKSLLMGRLREPKKAPSEFSGDTTQGIDIFSEVLKFDGRRIRVNYWDFGGQEVLHSMHRLFLSKQTLYVIVLNTRNDNQDAQADFWMRYVQSYAPGAPVLLVMNKIDQNKKAALNLPVLCRRFPNGISPENVLKVSAVEKDPKKFAEQFTNKLHDFIKQNIDRFQGFTTQEALIRERVDDARKKTAIDRSEFKMFCDAEGLKQKEKRDELIERFHDAGIVVHLKKGTPMYLNPAWITETLYMILSADTDSEANGMIPHKDIESMCDQNRNQLEGEDDAQHLIQIMQKYGLSFQHGEHEFIPMLCCRAEPERIEKLIQTPGTMEMQLIFEYLPSGLLYKLMADYRNDLDMPLTWFTGAKIGRGDENYVILRRDGNCLCIFANYTQKEKAVEKVYALAGEIERLADEPYSATIRERKIRYSWGNCVEYFDYDRLKRAKTKDLQYVASKVSDDPVAVCDILEQEDRSEKRDLDRLLQLVLEGCLILQNNQTYWWTRDVPKEMEGLLPKMNENARNRALIPVLERGFSVEDQPEGGESAEGIEPGRLDLRIRLKSGMPWSILEALNISEEKGDSKKRWLEHLKRLATKYNKNGFRHLILASYLLASEDHFGRVKDAYMDILSQTELPIFGGAPQICKNYPLDHCPQRVSVSRADYSGDAGDVSIFHFLVHIPEYKGKRDNKDKTIVEK